MNISDVFVGMFGVAGFLALLVYYVKRCYSRLNCVKRRRILPTILDDVEDNEIDVPRVVDATEIAYSDDEDAFLEEIPSASILNISNLQTHFATAKESEKYQIYVEVYKNNEVSNPVVELPAKLIDGQDDDTEVSYSIC